MLKGKITLNAYIMGKKNQWYKRPILKELEKQNWIEKVSKGKEKKLEISEKENKQTIDKNQ